MERSQPPSTHGLPARQLTIMILIMTLMMGIALSGIFTVLDHGLSPGFAAAWLDRFWTTYVVVLPMVAIFSPIARRLAAKIELRFFATAKLTAPDPVATALMAWRYNAAGHRGDGFEHWLEMLADDVTITLPLGHFRGENQGATRAREIYDAIAKADPRLVYNEPLRITSAGNSVVIEFEDHGTIGDRSYRNRIAASFDIVAGKIAAYREYFGDIDPAVVAMMARASERTPPGSAHRPPTSSASLDSPAATSVRDDRASV